MSPTKAQAALARLVTKLKGRALDKPTARAAGCIDDFERAYKAGYLKKAGFELTTKGRAALRDD